MSEKYITVSHLSKKIGKAKVLKDISFSLAQNKVMGLQGINGSGKTMLLRAMAGLIRFEGKITVDGKDITGKEYDHNLGVLIEHPGFLSEFTAMENLELLSMIQTGIGKEEILQALHDVGLSPEDKRKYKKFSLGMKQRLGVAQAILGRPKLILLDEPTNGIDKDGMKLMAELIQNLKKEGSTVIIASHDKEFLQEVTDEIHCVEGGELIW
jgi:ABC-2 type transport system ATP-binding protein